MRKDWPQYKERRNKKPWRWLTPTRCRMCTYLPTYRTRTDRYLDIPRRRRWSRVNARRMFHASKSKHHDSRKIRGRIGFTYRDRILSQLNGDCWMAFKQALVNNRSYRLVETIFCDSLQYRTVAIFEDTECLVILYYGRMILLKI